MALIIAFIDRSFILAKIFFLFRWKTALFLQIFESQIWSYVALKLITESLQTQGKQRAGTKRLIIFRKLENETYLRVGQGIKKKLEVEIVLNFYEMKGLNFFSSCFFFCKEGKCFRFLKFSLFD